MKGQYIRLGRRGSPLSAIRRAAAVGQSCVRLTRSFREHSHSSVTPMERFLFFVWVYGAAEEEKCCDDDDDDEEEDADDDDDP